MYCIPASLLDGPPLNEDSGGLGGSARRLKSMDYNNNYNNNNNVFLLLLLLLPANGGTFEINKMLSADDTALVADSEVKLCRLLVSLVEYVIEESWE